MIDSIFFFYTDFEQFARAFSKWSSNQASVDATF